MIRHPRRAIPLAAAGLLAVAATLAPAPAAAAVPAPEERAELRLAADATAYAPGERVRIAAVVEVDRGWHVNAHLPSYDFLIPTVLELEPPAGWPLAEIVYPEPEMTTLGFADGPLAVYQGRAVIVVSLAVPDDAVPGVLPLTATLRYQACDDSSCLPPVTAQASLELTVGPGGRPANAALFAGGEPAAGPGLPLILLLGLIGGLILNAMPCVLPVLSLKVFGLVKSAGQGRAHVVVGSLATTAGILVSFWALALAAIAARAAGAAVGWGVQFQQPGFVTFLAVVVLLFCLNLWGLFEIPLPARLAGSLGGGPKEGLAGHFASGLFATLMATPCSAPFLGTAVGFALAQPASVIFAVFTAVGTGMALPYLALAAAPGAARWLPRPGAWMDTVRKLMGFLLAAAAVWLFYVLAAQVSAERLAAIELGLLALALFVWLRARAARGPLLRRVGTGGTIAAAALSLALALAPGAGAGTGAGAAAAEQRIPWQTFDHERALELAAGGRLVFVDVTADWCFTCKTNERLVLETDEIAELFERNQVLPMKADWTNRDDAIAAFLAGHGRYSIPFYALYRPGDEPHLFSELLTRGAVVEVVERSASR